MILGIQLYGPIARNTVSMEKMLEIVKRYSVNHFVVGAGGTGRETLVCLHQMELALTHMGMRAYDRIPVIRYNSEYVLPSLKKAGEVYCDKLENGFNMYY